MAREDEEALEKEDKEDAIREEKCVLIREKLASLREEAELQNFNLRDMLEDIEDEERQIQDDYPASIPL